MKIQRILFAILLTIVTLSFSTSQCSAFWVWTPETNKWSNPKYSVKETPSDQLQYGISFYESKKYKEAVKEFKKLIKNYPKAREAPDAQYYIGLCFEDQEDLFRAFKEYQMVIDKYPFSEKSGAIVKRQYEIGLRILEGGKKVGKFKKVFLDQDARSVDIFRTVIKNSPYGEFAPIAQYKIGLCLFERELFQESRDEFEKVVNDYPQSEWAKAAKYQIALVDSKRSTSPQYDQKITQVASAEFKEFLDGNPDAELSEQAVRQIHKLKEKEAGNNFIIAQFYEKQKEYNAAKVYYDIVVKDYKDSTFAPKALRKIQEINLWLE